MTVEELMRVAKTEVVGLDGMDGKKLFDTSINKKEYCKKYYSGEVINIWPEIKRIGSSYNIYIKTVIHCYVMHDSWKGEDIL